MEPEDIVCEGFLRTGEKIVFTNKRLLILEVKQVKSLSEIHKSEDSLVSEHPIGRIKDVCPAINEISGIAEMVVNLISGEELRCNFGILISGKLYFGRNTISVQEHNAVVNAYANEIRRILGM
jgi:hypothetical protein